MYWMYWMYWIYLFFLIRPTHALEIIKPDFHTGTIHLKIIRSIPDSFQSYTLIHQNAREMDLTCSHNKIFDNNPQPLLRYRNFYNTGYIDFILPNEQACQDLVKFIELAHFGIDEQHPLLIDLDKRTKEVSKIIYPNIDPYLDQGDLNHLLPKKRVFINTNNSSPNSDYSNLTTKERM